MKNLKDMSIKEIADEIGMFIYAKDFNIYIEDMEMIKELNNKIESFVNDEIGNIKVQKYILDFMEKNRKYINMENLILVQLYRMEEFLKEIRKNNNVSIKKEVKNEIDYTEEEMEEKIRKSKELLKGYKGSIIVFDSENIARIASLDIISNKNISNKNLEKLKELDKKGILDFACTSIYWIDIENLICQDRYFGDTLADYIITNTFEKTLPNYANLTQEEMNAHMESLEYKKQFAQESKKAFKEYSSYISIDKLLLVSIYRNLDLMDTYSYDKKTCNIVKDQLAQMCDLVDKKARVKGKIRIVKKNKEICEEDISITAKDMKKLLDENFISGQYIGRRTIEKIKEKIFNENEPLEQYDPRIVHLLKIDINELMELINDYSNFEYLMHFDMINDNVLEYILNVKQDISPEIYTYLLQNGKIDKQDIFNLYSAEVMRLEQITKLAENKELEIEEIAQESELIRLYKNFTRREENEEELNKYLKLYKELKIKDKNINDKKENGNKLIEELGTDFEEEDLKKMYTLGIIPVDTAIEWGGDSITQEMFNNGILKPIDAKRLYKENVLNLEMIKQVLRSSKISDEDKLALIGSTFDSQEDFDIKMELMQYLNLVSKENNSNGKGRKHIGRENEVVKEERNAYITDPFSRWQLISLLDDEYSQEVLRDGYIIFKLPNVKNGTVIVEKMFKKSQDKIIASYGNATYILSEEQFSNYEKHITEQNLEGKTINLGELAELKEQGKADKLNHSSKWGNNIRQYFEIGEEQSKYNEKQIEKIDRAIESIENSRRLK